MNLFYGLCDRARTDLHDFERLVAAHYAGSAQVLGDGAGLSLGFTRDDDGIALGKAGSADGMIQLVLLGCLNQPVPGWSGASPLDDPDATAAFLLQRYREHGDRFAEGLIGQFAIAIRDEKRRAMILASDPTGIRTVFYNAERGRLAFATNLAVLASASGPAELDRTKEDFLLCYGYIPNGSTLFANIGYLTPGSVAVFEDGELALSASPAHDPWAEEFGDYEAVFADEPTALAALNRALELATEQQLASDPKAAVLLGGADSALVASLLQRAGKEVETFSFHYEDAAFNQPHTDTLATYLGIRHTWVPITREMLGNGLDTYPWTFNFPTNWPNYVIQTQALTKVIREAGYRHIYSGDGCDGTFLGYPRTHVFAKVLERMGRIPPAAVRGSARLLNNGIAERHGGRIYTLALNTLRSGGRAMPERGYSNFKVMDENSLARLKGSDPREMARANETILQALAAPLAGASLDRLAYAGKNALSPNRSKLAGSSDSTGAVINSPYLHSGMKRFATAIPDRLLRPEGDQSSYNGKYLLFKACEEFGLLPREIIYQKKISAVDAPVDAWYEQDLRDNFRSAFAGLPFDPGTGAERLLDDSFANRLYRKRISSDALTSHAACLLATYGRFTELAGR